MAAEKNTQDPVEVTTPETMPETMPETTVKFNIDDVYADYAKAAEKDKNDKFEVNLLDKFDVEFTSDFAGFKAGQKATVSTVARDFYLKNGAIKK